MVGRRREKTVAENLDTQIRDNAAGPKKATGDSGSVEQHSLTDQIAADRVRPDVTTSPGVGWSLRRRT
jgi:hypothetical protein